MGVHLTVCVVLALLFTGLAAGEHLKGRTQNEGSAGSAEAPKAGSAEAPKAQDSQDISEGGVAVTDEASAAAAGSEGPKELVALTASATASNDAQTGEASLQSSLVPVVSLVMMLVVVGLAVVAVRRNSFVAPGLNVVSTYSPPSA